MTTSSLHDSAANDEHKLILASRVEHVPVYNQAGDRIGHIADLSIDRVTGQVICAVMSFGGFLGIGRRFHPLPWTMLHYDTAAGGYLINLDRAALEAAPHYTAEELEALGGAGHHAHTAMIYNYYGSGPPYM